MTGAYSWGPEGIITPALSFPGSQEDESHMLPLSYDINDQLLPVQPHLRGNLAIVLKEVLQALIFSPSLWIQSNMNLLEDLSYRTIDFPNLEWTIELLSPNPLILCCGNRLRQVYLESQDKLMEVAGWGKNPTKKAMAEWDAWETSCVKSSLRCKLLSSPSSIQPLSIPDPMLCPLLFPYCTFSCLPGFMCIPISSDTM